MTPQKMIRLKTPAFLIWRTVLTYACVMREKPALKATKKRGVLLASVLPFRSREQRAGVSVRATIPESTTETEIVMANCLYIWPARPPMKETGMNTEQSTSTMAIRAEVTSPMALAVASLGGRCSVVIIRSTFSRTTMASSTTMPMASTRPNRVRVLMV